MGFDPTTSKFVKALRIVQRYSSKAVEDKVSFFVELGFDVNDVWAMFKKYPPFLNNSEKKKMEKAIDTLLCLGFSKGDLTVILKRFPQFIGLSAESLKEKTEFLVKEMKWPLKAVVSTPAVFGYSLEKRTVPRCNVLKALMTKGLLGSELPTMSPVLAITDEAFLNKYVRKHNDKKLVAELMASFTGKKKKNKKNLDLVK
ncbi:BnaA09g10500D [Brassica napus]|uniref:BnaA09g10500D protein n=1 Tax=Brassica napus TaxID=3708 RepID=A0A078HSS2_BRANA|nr:BnaA09g10500D [Brassica napus]